jgi:hypothetical protein
MLVCRESCPVIVVLVAASLSPVAAQPKPGDIFREYHYTSDTIIEFDPASKQQDPKALLRRSISQRRRSLDIWDLEDATRAEVSLEFWGGHPGTSGQKLRVNDGDWIDIPQIQGTPGDPRCFHRYLPGTVHIPLSIGALKSGPNQFEFKAGSQICHSFDWGIYKVYSFTVRVYYKNTKPHPAGRIVAPVAGAAIGDDPVVEAEAQGSPPAPGKLEFTPGDVRQVDFLGLYEDFNWEGDGVYRQWHYQTDQGVLRRHIGTANGPQYRVTWSNRWVPDQSRPVQIAARITNVHGITYFTTPVEVRLTRNGRSVRMYRATDIPEAFSVRAGQRMSCKLPIPDDPSTARAARIVLSTWAGNHGEAFGFNEKKIANRIGRNDYYSFDTMSFDPNLLHTGDNEFFIFSGTQEHAMEINWPGPVVLLEFLK